MEVVDSCFSGEPTTSNYGGATAITSLHSDIISSNILNKLDGPTLASTSCASPQLHTLCSDENLWKKICNSNFPSTTDLRVQNTISTFPSGHRSFFSDSFPTLHRHLPGQPKLKNKKARSEGTPELISAVDVHCGDYLVYSKVVVTETLTGWFASSPLRIDLVEPKEFVPMPVSFDGEESQVMKILEEKLKLSWIIIDPTRKRAVNLSSNTPVEVRRHWLTGDIQVRYGTVMADAGVEGGYVKYGVTVTCGGKEGGELHVREISMQVEDMEGKILNGKDSLVILHEAMEGKRTKLEIGEEKRRYENFIEMRRMWRENKKKKERRLDMVCVASGVTIFFVFWALILFR